MANIGFLKKITLPKFSLDIFKGGPERVAGIDIGGLSAKVVQLRYDRERAILETYGELLTAGYLKEESGGGKGALRYSDKDLAEMLRDLLREANVGSRDVVFGVPAAVSFITPVSFPRISQTELESAIRYEARKYIPIPISEVVLDWDVLESGEGGVVALLVAVPREILDKFNRVSGILKINTLAAEVESFSMMRSLIKQTSIPTAIVDMGESSTVVAVTDKGRLRESHTIERGSRELTRALERSLAISGERAEAVKKETGISEKIEERETTSTILPLVETLLSEVERLTSLYNRKASRRIQRIVLSGGGSNLKGLVDHAATKFGIEVAKGDPFTRVITPAFMQPVLREIGPSFSVAVGLALREITR